MKPYLLITWLLLAIVCEVYIKYRLVDNDGHTEKNDDESKALVKQHAYYFNKDMAASRRFVRALYVFGPLLLISAIFGNSN